CRIAQRDRRAGRARHRAPGRARPRQPRRRALRRAGRRGARGARARLRRRLGRGRLTVSYIDESLVAGETILHRARVSWWSQFGLVLLGILTLIIVVGLIFLAWA